MDRSTDSEQYRGPSLPCRYSASSSIVHGIVYCMIIAIACLPRAGRLYASEQWTIGKNENGIVVSHRTVPGSGFRETEAEMIVRESLASIISFLSDINAYQNWYPNTKSIRILDQPSDRELIVHQIVVFPAPLKDRDVVMRSTVTQDAVTRAVTITMTVLPDYLPPQKNIVRIRKCTGYWRLIPQGDGSVRVIYRMHGEPGGTVPAWVANAAVTKRPYEIMVRLREGIKGEQYRNARLSWVIDDHQTKPIQQ